MERCARCDVGEDKVQLYDAIYEGEIALLCERCSIIENITLLKKPSYSQLRESEKGTGVYERMRKISGIKEEKKQEHFFINERLMEIEKNPSLEMPAEKNLNLIEHFHWEIMNSRRRKGLSQKQLGEQLGVSEIMLEMLEKGVVPENCEIIIRKLEQFFRIKLRKVNETEELLKKPEKKPVLLDEEGNVLDLVPEPELATAEMHCKVEIKKDLATPLLNNMAVVECRVDRNPKKGILNQIEEIKEEEFNFEIEKKDFDLEKIDRNRVRVSDLMKLHRRKIEATKYERTEEQKKMQEKQKFIEARKEEFKSVKQKESMEIDNLLGGSELLKKED